MKAVHALHNEEACDYLFADEKFNDWVVTTAFYSALHFAHHELFPGNYEGTHHTGFDEYCIFLYKKRKAKRAKIISKHAATLQLVCRYLSFYPQYYWLYSNCMNGAIYQLQHLAGKSGLCKTIARIHQITPLQTRLTIFQISK
jgi:hypothetical protein